MPEPSPSSVACGKFPDNPTKDLMVGLYTNLKSMGLREAMRKAQLFALKKYKHPFNWAAFQVTGGT